MSSSGDPSSSRTAPVPPPIPELVGPFADYDREERRLSRYRLIRARLDAAGPERMERDFGMKEKDLEMLDRCVAATEDRLVRFRDECRALTDSMSDPDSFLMRMEGLSRLHNRHKRVLSWIREGVLQEDDDFFEWLAKSNARLIQTAAERGPAGALAHPDSSDDLDV
jgi:hypothetical protein